MQIAFKLGRDEEEVFAWPKDKFEMWVAFFKLQTEREQKAQNQG